MAAVNNLEEEDQLLMNGLLLCELRGRASTDVKLNNIARHVAAGADVNATDANDNSNTPLHVAAKRGEPDVVEFLLKHGANPNHKNINKHTPLELAKISTNKNKHTVIHILEDKNNVLNSSRDSIDRELPGKELKTKPLSSTNKNEVEENDLTNHSRPGTAGVSGQLYETKLIGLLLFRALNDNDIDEFYLGTNLADVGAFDDIAFKYSLKNDSQPKIFFIQAKHRDDPKKHKVTVDSVLKSNDDFSLDKYFKSYKIIRDKISQNSKNCMFQFQSDFVTLDCNFIIYTSAKEHFHKKKLLEIRGKENLLFTNEHGKIFMYDYNDEDIERLSIITSKGAVEELSKVFAKNIKIGSNYNNMLRDTLLKVYHVFLAENVIEVTSEHLKHMKAKFRLSFLESENEILVLLRNRVLDELQDEFKKSNLDKINYEFSLPNGFGNLGFKPNEKQYDDVCKVIIKVMKLAVKEDNDDIITYFIDDSMISRRKTIKNESDINLSEKNMVLLGKFVGSILIYDELTGFLKLQSEINHTPSEHVKKLIEYLKANFDVNCNRVRFNINVQNFPQMAFNKGYQNEIVEDFLKKMYFFTNQAKEDEIGELIKNEITERYYNENKENDELYQIKGDAIYLRYHDYIHNWWRHPDKYLTKHCNFYETAKHDILISPLLNIYSNIYTNQINRFEIKYNKEAVNILNKAIKKFLTNSNVKKIHIITKDHTLTSIKVLQCFKNALRINNYKFINFDLLISEDHIETILAEISDETTDIIVVVLGDCNYGIEFFRSLVDKKIKNQLIIISNSKLSKVLLTNFECIEHIDETSLRDLDTISRRIINDRQQIVFQGTKVPFASLVTEHMHHTLKDKILYKIMNKEVIYIGKNIEIKKDIKEFYIDRTLCTCPKMTGLRYQFDYNGANKNIKPENDKDNNIYLISNEVECNCLLEPKCMEDLTDKVVLIAAGPGMGKSTLVTHLMMQSKQRHKGCCFLKIDLLDLKNMFSLWQECKVVLTIERLLSVLYKSFSVYNFELFNAARGKTEILGGILFESNGKIGFKSEVVLLNSEQELAQFELQVFLNLYNQGEMSLIFDGFDEICPDYKKEAIAVLKLLMTSRIRYLWVTTRSYSILDDLESELETLSYQLKGLTPEKQICFLEKVVCQNSPKLQEFLNMIRRKIGDHTFKFSSTPLHLHMIADMYIHLHSTDRNSYISFKDEDLQDDLNLSTLYAKIVDIKFYKIRFGEKKNWDSYSNADPDLKLIIDRERKLFIRNHQMLAAYSLLDKSAENGIFTEDDLKLINDLIERFNLGEEKTGIIERISRNESKFVHFTFAEYFTCEYLCDKLTQDHSVCMYLINRILVMNNAGIRRFFDAKLENNDFLATYTAKSICDALLTQRIPNESALTRAVIERKDHLANFLLINLYTYVNKNSLDDFIELVTGGLIMSYIYKMINPPDDKLSQDYNSHHKKHMQQIVEIVRRVDSNKLVKLFFQKDIPIYNMFHAAFLRHDLAGIKCDMDLLLVNYLNSDDLTKLFTTTLMGGLDTMLHILLKTGQGMSVLKYLEKLSPEQCFLVFSARDALKRTPAHYATQLNNYVFLEHMERLVGNEKFKIICRLEDKWRLIPFQFRTCREAYTNDNDNDTSDAACGIRAIMAKAGFEFRLINGRRIMMVLYDLSPPK